MGNSYDVFISYSSKEQKIAEGICGYLESRKYRCFVAYRDIPKGKIWAAVIPSAIHTSRMMLVVFSDSFNISNQTDRELELAAEDKIPILTFRINDTVFTGAKEYYLKNLNWIDAFPEPEKCFGQLYDSVSKLVPKPEDPIGDIEIIKEDTSEINNLFHNLKVKVDEDCLFYIDGEERSNLTSGNIEKFSLPHGEYELKFVSVEDPADFIELEFEMPDFDKFLKVSLKDICEKRQNVDNEKDTVEDNQSKQDGITGLSFYIGGMSFNMMKVEGGTFMMGAQSDDEYEDNYDPDADEDAKPVHEVTLSDYYIGETPVTQELWESVMNDNPSVWVRSDNPVESINWDDCQAFIKKLNNKLCDQLPPDHIFRLPTEAQWEFAARGGNLSIDYKYCGSDDIDDVAWYDDNSNDKPHSVRQKDANELNLYDMSGNVWEWCQDWYGDYQEDDQTDPEGPSCGSARVCRGGGWNSDIEDCIVTYRGNDFPDAHFNNVGFRLALVNKVVHCPVCGSADIDLYNSRKQTYHCHSCDHYFNKFGIV